MSESPMRGATPRRAEPSIGDAAWLGVLLTDAQESKEGWESDYNQANAEIRILKSQSSPPGKSLTAAATGDTGDHNQLHPSVGVGGGFARDDVESEKRNVLANVIALEQHSSELEEWMERISIEAKGFRSNASKLDEQLQKVRERAKQHGASANSVTARVKALRQEHELKEADHEAQCGALQDEVNQHLEAGKLRPEAVCQLGDTSSAIAQLNPEVQELLESATRLRQERDQCLADQDDARDRERRSRDAIAQCNVDIRDAKVQIQARAPQLTRLQGEVSRTRAKGERTRRQLATQLSQCQSELAVSQARADEAASALKKVRERQGNELRKLRNSTGDLQEQVDERLNGIDLAEQDIEALRMHEFEMIEAERLHQGREAALAEDAIARRQLANNLEQKVQHAETGKLALQERLRMSQSQNEAMQERFALTKSEVESHHERRADAVSTVATLQEELRQEQVECREQSLEMAALREVEETVQAMEAKRSNLLQDQSKLQETVKQSVQSFERFLADMREVSRRVARLKANQDDLQEVLPKTRDAAPGAIENAIGRAIKRVDAITAYLEYKEVGQKKPANPDMMATSKRSQTALQKQLQALTETEMFKAIAAAKKSAIAEQQQLLSDVGRRASEMQKVKKELQTSEVKLDACKAELVQLRLKSSQERADMKEKVARLDHEGVVGTHAVNLDFSDLLQEQAVERDNLQRQIDRLRSEVEPNNSIAHGGDLADADDTTNDEDPYVLQRLQEVEAEIDALKSDEEELLQWRMKLKAILASQGEEELIREHSKGTPRSPRHVGVQRNGNVGVHRRTASLEQRRLEQWNGNGEQRGDVKDYEKAVAWVAGAEPLGGRNGVAWVAGAEPFAPMERVVHSSSPSKAPLRAKSPLRSEVPTSRSLDQSKEGVKASDNLAAAIPERVTVDGAIASGVAALDVVEAENDEAADVSRLPIISALEPRALTQHLRSLSTRTPDSTPGSSANVPMTWPQGAQGAQGAQGPARSISVRSLQSSGSLHAILGSRVVAPGTPRSPGHLSMQRPSSPTSPTQPLRLMMGSVSTPTLRSLSPPVSAANLVASPRALVPAGEHEVVPRSFQSYVSSVNESYVTVSYAPVPTVSYANASTWPSPSASCRPVLPGPVNPIL